MKFAIIVVMAIVSLSPAYSADKKNVNVATGYNVQVDAAYLDKASIVVATIESDPNNDFGDHSIAISIHEVIWTDQRIATSGTLRVKFSWLYNGVLDARDIRRGDIVLLCLVNNHSHLEVENQAIPLFPSRKGIEKLTGFQDPKIDSITIQIRAKIREAFSKASKLDVDAQASSKPSTQP